MRFITPTSYKRLNEAVGVVYLALAILLWLSLISYQPLDPSWNSASSRIRPHNLIGPIGAYFSDFCLQSIGLAAFVLPVLLCVLGWKWVRSEQIQVPLLRLFGFGALVLGIATALSLGPQWMVWNGSVPAGGVLGLLLADAAISAVNLAGAILVTLTGLILSLYLATTFSFRQLGFLKQGWGWIAAPFHYLRARWQARQQRRAEIREQKRVERIERERQKEAEAAEQRKREREETRNRRRRENAGIEDTAPTGPYADPLGETEGASVGPDGLHEQQADSSPWDEDEIPIRPLGDMPVPTMRGSEFHDYPEHTAAFTSEAASQAATPPPGASQLPNTPKPVPEVVEYRKPSTVLLNEVPSRSGYDEQELKEVAQRIKSKFEEFNVRGNVVQINPGPVVTTFEFKPEAGVKYNRITALSEDLCLGLQAESILIERIPAKPTVGIEVPNSKREIISLR
jgi:DNA segregation ATPase FtsK/SpoIIIE, S-DNA-T family